MKAVIITQKEFLDGSFIFKANNIYRKIKAEGNKKGLKPKKSLTSNHY